MTSITIVLLQQTLNSVSYIAVNTDKDIHAHLNGNNIIYAQQNRYNIHVTVWIKWSNTSLQLLSSGPEIQVCEGCFYSVCCALFGSKPSPHHHQ